MSQIIMALDQGTSSSRTILFNSEGHIIDIQNEPLPSSYPKSGWVEQDAQQIWKTQKDTIGRALDHTGIKMKDIAGIGITNQRETVIAWNKQTGEPCGNAIVWQCRRTADDCDRMKAEGLEAEIRAKTGLLLDPYFSGTKIKWMLEHHPEIRSLADKGHLAIGTVDSWLIWNLTGGAAHVTDASNASRTMLYNIIEHQWDATILEQLGIPINCLPQVVASSGIIGYTDDKQWSARIPICGVAGDQQAALFGQACFKPGLAKNTYGTGSFLLMNAGNTPKISSSGLLTTIAWRIGDEVTYALEGSVFVAGALIQWLRDQLGFFKDAAETEAMATTVPSSNGVYIVPAFVGLGAPYWDPYARGTMVGLTSDTNRFHITRAALEAIAYQSYDLLKAIETDTGIHLKQLRVDGGATTNNFLCQFQSDILGLTVSRPEIIETTAMGAAFLAGLAIGCWSGLAEIEQLWRENRRFEPRMPDTEVKELVDGWHLAVERSRQWAQPE